MLACAAVTRRTVGFPAPRVLHELPDAEAPQSPPGRRGFAREALAALQLARLARAAPWLALAPRGDGGVVIDVPGWMAPEASLAPLRAYLRALGHDSRPWRGGVNRGRIERDVELLAAQVRRATSEGGRVSLVGWSLGGVLAREVARELPELVRNVVTFGSPVVGGPTYTLAAQAYGEEECERIRVLSRQREHERPIEVPLTVIYTRRDMVVDWRACIDRSSPRATHVEVRSSHLGLGVDPDVWWTTARSLSRQL